MDYADQLDLTTDEFEALSQYLQYETYDDLEYRRLPDYRRSVEKGTVLLSGTVVRGFPKIPRTLVLETGIPHHFAGRIAVEEKLDGYNVRIVRVDGNLLAFTRGGLLCPFTTHTVCDLLDLHPFFDDHPESMLCGEMIGPENPYTTHDYPGVNSIAFRAFDIRNRTAGEPLPVRTRRDRCEEYGVPQTALLGVYDSAEAADEVIEIIRELDREGREGIVMKNLNGGRELKYTTSAANCGDLAYAFSLPFDYGQPFTFRRLIREGFQAHEWSESEVERRERARELGEGILLPMVGTIDAVADGEPACERHTVRADSPVVADLFEHLREQGIHLEVEADRREEGKRVVTFCKRVKRTTDKTEAYLSGTIVKE